VSVFANYANYYDLLYQDKDYVGEADFIHNLLKKYAPDAKTIMEMGCGTGNHAMLLAKEGYQIYGVDSSDEMLAKANDRLSGLPDIFPLRPHFSLGDVRNVRLNQTFDVVISLFHVISYQSTNIDLQSAINTAKAHLNPGGIFIFDVWYGPTVLRDLPSVRVKRLKNEFISVTRLAEPKILENDNCVDVNYSISIKDINTEFTEEIQETHRMRYFSKPELEFFLNQGGFEMTDCKEWMTDKEPGFDTWGVYFVAKI
jgi:SAM-dependent methyltransferase